MYYNSLILLLGFVCVPCGCAHLCAHVCLCLWRPEDSLRCHFSGVITTPPPLFFSNQNSLLLSHLSPSTPVDPRNPPFFSSPALKLQACFTMPGHFNMVCGAQTWILMFSRQTLLQLSYLPSPRLYFLKQF